MENSVFSRVLVVCCIVAVCAGWAVGQDWPQWRGAGRDGTAEGFSAPAKWPTELSQKWKVTVGSGDATPALVGDRLYVFTRQGGDEVIMCLKAADGGEVWKDKYAADAVTGAPARHPGPRSSPAVGEGKVVTLGVGGVVSCLDAASGKVVWRNNPYPKTVPTFFTSSSPIIVDGKAIVQLGKAGNGALAAFDLATGDEKWRCDGGAEYSSPAVLEVAGTKQIVAITDQNVVGVNAADGKLLWQLPFAVGRRAYNAATPIIDEQTVIYTGAGRGTKAVKVEKQGDRFVPRELWSSAEPAPQYTTPVLKNGLLFGFSDGGNLYCINAADGKTAWVDTAGHGRGFASIVDAGSVVVALPSTSELIVYKADAGAYDQIANYKVAGTETYAHPVLSGNRVFVKDSDSLAMLTVQ